VSASQISIANDMAGQKFLPMPLCLNDRRHALKDVIAKDEVMKERGGGMANDHALSKGARGAFIRPARRS
jgi:hypothetical protein